MYTEEKQTGNRKSEWVSEWEREGEDIGLAPTSPLYMCIVFMSHSFSISRDSLLIKKYKDKYISKQANK